MRREEEWMHIGQVSAILIPTVEYEKHIFLARDAAIHMGALRSISNDTHE